MILGLPAVKLEQWHNSCEALLSYYFIIEWYFIGLNTFRLFAATLNIPVLYVYRLYLL